MYLNKAGRHFWIAENLFNLNYSPTIFCSNFTHPIPKKIIIEHGFFERKKINNIEFVIVKTSNPSNNNGLKRIFNMIFFYFNVFKTMKLLILKNDIPDIIIASSVHPLTLIAGLRIGRKFGIPVICEIRDLWPESIFAYSSLKKSSFLAKFLYQGEKWIYKNADSLIFTWEGGKQYITNQGWEKQINLNKVYYINNGIDYNKFFELSKLPLEDSDIINNNYFKIIYTGSIGKVNNLSFILEVNDYLLKSGYKDIYFYIYGDGNERKELEKQVNTKKVDNIIFKGNVDKSLIPAILRYADITLLHNSSTILDQYGQSQNKLFEYLASGKPVLQTYTTSYSIIEKHNAGIMSKDQTVHIVSKDIIKLYNDIALRKILGINALKASKLYDFVNLTDKFVNVINHTLNGDK